jgi:formylglycine-generating enzyme required for sulfatase activity
MTGNVWERVSTWYDVTDVAADQAGWAYVTGWTNEAEGGSAYTPFGANAGPDTYTGPRQWIRGGGWLASTNAGGWAASGNYSPRFAFSNIGFRCCS